MSFLQRCGLEYIILFSGLPNEDSVAINVAFNHPVSYFQVRGVIYMRSIGFNIQGRQIYSGVSGQRDFEPRQPTVSPEPVRTLTPTRTVSQTHDFYRIGMQLKISVIIPLLGHRVVYLSFAMRSYGSFIMMIYVLITVNNVSLLVQGERTHQRYALSACDANVTCYRLLLKHVTLLTRYVLTGKVFGVYTK